MLQKYDKESAMLFRYLIPIIIFLNGCASIIGTSTKITPIPGEQDHVYKGKGGSFINYDGIELWTNGAPDREYVIVGLLDQVKSTDSFNDKLFNNFNMREIIRVAKENNGDGIIKVGDITSASGYDLMVSVNPSGYGTGIASPSYFNNVFYLVIRYIDTQ